MPGFAFGRTYSCMNSQVAIVWARAGEPKRPTPPSRSREREQSPFNGLRGSALLITNLIKLGGLVMALNEALVRTQDLRPIVLASAAFMMAGAQGAETLLDKFLGK